MGPAFFQDGDGFGVGCGIEVTRENGALLVGRRGKEGIDGPGLFDAVLGNIVLKVCADEAQGFAVRSLQGDGDRSARIGLPFFRGIGVGQGLDQFIKDRQTREDGIAKKAALIMLRGTETRGEAGQFTKLLQLMHAA